MQDVARHRIRPVDRRPVRAATAPIEGLGATAPTVARAVMTAIAVRAATAPMVVAADPMVVALHVVPPVAGHRQDAVHRDVPVDVRLEGPPVAPRR